MKTLKSLGCLLAVALAPQFVSGAVLGPYTPDASTAYLFHFDEPAGSYVAINAAGSGAAGTNAVAYDTVTTNTFAGVGVNSPTNFNVLGGTAASGFAIGGFGKAANLANTLGAATNGLGVDANLSGGFSLDNAGTIGNDMQASHASIVGPNNSITLEALINVTGTNGNQEIICTDNGGGNTVRGFQFRLKGPFMELNFIGTGTGGVAANDITAAIPSSGPNAFVAGQWFHVALVHGEVGGNATNIFYWTALSDSALVANAIGTNTAAKMDPADPMILDIGNEARAVPGSALSGGSAEGLQGSIDEVRISKVARSANQMMFYSPVITFLTQPSNQIAAINQAATFNTSAVGSGTLNYQWYFFNATTTNAIAGATNTILTINAGPIAGSTNYFVVAANGISTPATSSVATITIRVPLNLEWAGTGSTWDTASQDWTVNGNVSQTAYTEVDNVTFDNLGAAQPTASLAQILHPSSVTVAGSTSYLLNGSGSIAGPGTLAMNGSGTLTVDTTNSNTGGTSVSGGTLQIGDGSFTGAIGTGPLTNNGSVTISPGAAGAFIFTNGISGTGGLTVNGAAGSTVTLSGSNSYAGNVLVSAGSLRPENPSALGGGTATVNSGAQIFADVNVDLNPTPMILNGTGIAGDGALRKGGAGISSYGGAITLGSTTTIDVDGGATLNLTNASGINGVTANANLTLAGSGTGSIVGPLSLGSGNLTANGGTWTVAPNNSFSGLTTINAGALRITGAGSLGPVPGSFNASQVTLNGGTLEGTNAVTLNDGNIGIELTASSIIATDTNSTLTISNAISTSSGSFILTKSGPGTLVLNGSNPFNGIFDTDTASTTASDGTTVISSTAAIANIPAIPGVPFINIRDNNGGSSTLALNGSAGSITVAPDINLSGRNVLVPAIESVAGDNVISGNITLVVGGGDYIFQSDSGSLTLSAVLPYATPTSSGRTFTFQGAGTSIVSGGIQDGSNNGTSNVWNNVIKNGTGLLSLPVANSYSGTTTVSNGVLSLTGSLNSLGGVTVVGGLLVGNGSITGPVAVQPAGSIEAGATNAIGSLSLSSTLTLSGNTVAKINRNTLTSDQFTGQTGVTYGGTLTVTNLAGTLLLGDSFTLFSPGASASNFSSIAGSPGAGLAYSFTNGILSVVNGPATNPTNITLVVSGSTLTLSWPADHQGWFLQSQTNTLGAGLGTNWVDISGSSSVTQKVITIAPASPVVFYRLRSP